MYSLAIYINHIHAIIYLTTAVRHIGQKKQFSGGGTHFGSSVQAGMSDTLIASPMYVYRIVYKHILFVFKLRLSMSYTQ